MLDLNDIGRGLKEKISRVSGDNSQRSTGRIVYSGDGIIKIAGLSDVQYNELLDVRGGYHALALNLEHDSVGAVLFSGEDRVRFGDYVYSTGKAVEMKVGEEMLGRIVDPLGNLIRPNYISERFPKMLKKNGLPRIRF